MRGSVERKDGGWAMMESAFALAGTVFLILGTLYFYHWYTTTNSLSEIVDRHVYESSVKPFTVSNITNGTLSIDTRGAALSTYIDEAATELEAQLVVREQAKDPTFSQADYYIEVAWAEVQIDEETGEFQSFVTSPFSDIEVRGTLSLPGEVEARTALPARFIQMTERTDGNGVFLGAIPTAYFGATDRANNYQPRAVMVGARAILNMDRGISGDFYSNILDPYISRVKTVVLRGEYEL